ncbi:MAG: hypothetical protein KJO84_04835 [Acidimicrobiia bacterium]|nr:hypothetical protein [Acidimicrobiia bacterium]
MSEPGVDRELPPEDFEDQRVEKVPFGFALTLVALGLYLGWRLIEGIVWLIQRF